MRAARFLLCVLCLAPVPLAAHSVPLRLRAQSANTSWPPSPPSAPVRPVTDTYDGTQVTDPYRNMENLGSVHRLPGNVYLYSKLLAGEDTYKLYIRKGLTGEEKLLVDPERITIAQANRRKGKNAIGSFVPSNGLKYVAVTIVPGGSENDTEIHVKPDLAERQNPLSGSPGHCRHERFAAETLAIGQDGGAFAGRYD